MRKTIAFLFSALALTIVGCKGRKTVPAIIAEPEESTAVDSTVYGVCGDGTAMHTLQLITDLGDTIDYALLDADDNEMPVAGGMMAGDHMAVYGHDTDEGRVADKVINITSLLGHWTSIDKNFVIEEGGTIASEVKAETSPWTSWKIFNGHLLLNRDTFDVVSLGADSLYIENRKGIFVFKRQLQ